MVEAAAEQLVCVTGAGGFIGSWLVKELLQRGYAVRGTARDPEDSKNSHLRALDGAQERLSLYHADVLDYMSLRRAFSLCDGVFHVASPVSNDPNWYCYAKMAAEKTAIEEASKRGIQLVIVIPSVTIGRMLQPTLNLTLSGVATYMKGTKKAYSNAVGAYVDVRDVALAHILVYEDVSTHGRYLCIGDMLHQSEFLQMMRELFPQYPITTKCKDENKPVIKPYKFSTQRLSALGMKFTPLKESLYNTVVSLQENGHIPVLLHKSSL
ncbi:hypothetical protein BDA96_03G121500 [Sorghum bicolor]|uniref:NAD-dependent epimerase/dehydratase domain-containing protein n=1 Tax=Sorghum bicolor TaxID=4558 RepID=A0A921RAW2_SORBI|nr:hypothetical protein BDA96_03G121500 [Sorghum bicolor]